MHDRKCGNIIFCRCHVHFTVTRSFNEQPNRSSLCTLICNTFKEGHPNFLQNIFLYSWNDYYSLFYHYNSSCTVFWVSSFHLSINIVVLYEFTVLVMYIENFASKVKAWGLSHGKKVQDCNYVFGSLTTFQRRKEWICACESRCRQVSVRLHVSAGFFCP